MQTILYVFNIKIIRYHFVDMHEMVSLGSGAERQMISCADAKKISIHFFARKFTLPLHRKTIVKYGSN
jgi:hypothetical protein